MEENDASFNRLIALIRKHRGRLKREVTLSTTLGRDLGMDGDDAGEFMDEYFALFQIDASEFKFQNFFGEEGFTFSGLINLFKKDTLIPITVGHLLECAKKRKWEVPQM